MTILFFISHTILQFLHAIIHVIILTFSQIHTHLPFLLTYLFFFTFFIHCLPFYLFHSLISHIFSLLLDITLLFHSILNQFHCLSFAYVVLTFDTPFPFILTFIHLLPPYVKRSLTPFIIQFFLIIYPQFRFPTVPLQFVN